MNMLTDYRVPENPFVDFRRQMGRFFSEMAGVNRSDWPFNSLSGSLPSSNIWETDKAFFIEVSAPGIEADQIGLSMLGSELTVTLTRPEVDEVTENRRYLRQERIGESSSLGITLPASADVNAITADVKNGVLTIRIPKSESAQVKKIEVKTGK